MPMVPEATVAMLACARIGAVHSVVFGGFSAEALADRIVDSNCKTLITANGTFRGAKAIPMKPNADQAMSSAGERMGEPVETCIVVRRVAEDSGIACDMQDGEIFGGMRRWQMHLPIVHARRWMRRIRFSFSTPPGRPGNQRGCCIPPGDTWSTLQ